MAVKHVTIYECDNCHDTEKGNPNLVGFELGLERKLDLCQDCARAVRGALNDRKAARTVCHEEEPQDD